MLNRFLDAFFSLPVIRKFRPFYEKRKDLVLYAFFGILTTVVSFCSFWAFEVILKNVHWHVYISNTISWICAVEFAFFTNRRWVFNSPTNTFYSFIRQMALFYTGRFVSFLIEMFLMWAFVTMLGVNSLVVKIFATIIVLIINYIVSKLVVFRKKPDLVEVTND